MQELSESVQEEHLDQSVFSCLSQFMLLPSLGSEIENLKMTQFISALLIQEKCNSEFSNIPFTLNLDLEKSTKLCELDL